MNELVVISKKQIGQDTVDAVDARELHGKLEVQTRFNDWIVRRIEETQLSEGLDFTSLLKSEKAENTYINTKEYALSLDAAKHIAMLERSEKGKQIRQYFIDFEKKAKALVATKPLTLAETFRGMAQLAEAQEVMLVEQSRQALQIKQIEEKQAAVETQIDYFTVVGYANIVGKKRIDRAMAQGLGKLATRKSKAAEVHIGKASDPVFGEINTYHRSILESVFADFFSDDEEET